MMAFVFGVIADSSFAGSILYVLSSISMKTGLAPVKLMASTVAIKVLGTVITSSPGPISRARSASQIADVPLETPIANSQSQYFA